MILTTLLRFMAAAANAPCPSGNKGNILGFPTWYAYLPGTYDPTTHTCSPSLTHLSYIWLIVAAIIEILLRVAALVAVAFVILGAVNYMTSSGDPEKTSRARGAITDALVGLTIAVMASAIVAYIAGHLA